MGASETPKLLVVDDNLIIFTIVKRAFESKQGSGPRVEVIYAANGKQGIEVTRAELPDIILLDWVMPGFSGDYFLQMQALEPSLARVPVLIYTASSDHSVEGVEKKYPMVKQIVHKPAAPTKLRTIITPFLVQELC